MRRRSFLASSALTGSASLSAAAAQAATATPAILEFRYFRCRNTTDNQRVRLTDWLSRSVAPAVARVGAGPLGLFNASIGMDAPFILAILSHASMTQFEQTHAKLMADADFTKASEAFFAGPGLPFQRMETQLLRAFNSFPSIEIPPKKDGARLFELRCYESNTPLSLAKKIAMFGDGEIDIFRKAGMLPVLFGEMVVGPRMPNLTYMVAHDSLTARENNWRAFGGSPEWKKMAATPGLSDGEVVSNISTTLLSPMAGSQIR
jgi:hypothetical protein